MAEKVNEEAEAWGTLEELLLACAVNRHGSTSWESIAKELQKRMKRSFAFAFSPKKCERKYVDLKRRFNLCEEQKRENGDEELLRVVDELRRLRVEELKREVHRHDLSIVSLQLKVKRLEEEREKSTSKADESDGESDLMIEPDGNAMETGVKTAVSERSSLEMFDSAEDRSFNESNSASHNNKNCSGPDSPEEGKERESKPKELEPDAVREIRPSEETCSGSASRPAELGESWSESREEPQSSDVQSLARLSKKRRRCFRLDEEEASPANRRPGNKSQPLIQFLEILRSHTHGSIFLRRLVSQKPGKHGNMILQDMDLDTVQSKLEKGTYDNCHSMFYRDLLLIFTNATVFYCNSSIEHLAARELRKLVVHEVAQTIPRKPNPNPEPTPPDLVVKKPRSSATNMIVCRKRISGFMQESMKRPDEEGKKEKPVKKDRSGLTLRNSNSNSNGNGNGNSNSNGNSKKMMKVDRKSSSKKSNKEEEDDNGKQMSVLKKQVVENFLRRMNQNSPSGQDKANNDHHDSGKEEKKIEKAARGGGKKRGGGNLRKNTTTSATTTTNNNNGDVVVSRRNSGRQGEKERAAGGRRPKRKVAMTNSRAESRNGGRYRVRDGDEKSKKKARR